MDALSKSKPDGYTIGMGASGSLATSPALGESVPYDPLKAFQPIAAVSAQRSCSPCRRTRPLKSIRDVIETEKRGNPKLTIGHGGAIMHLTAALFNSSAGLDTTLVTYKGTGPVVTDLLGAHIPLGIVDIPSAEAALRLRQGPAAGDLLGAAVRGPAGRADIPGGGAEGLRGDRLPRRAGASRAAAGRAGDPQQGVRHGAARSGGAGAGSLVRQPADDDRSQGIGDFIASEIKKWTAVVDAAHLRQK